MAHLAQTATAERAAVARRHDLQRTPASVVDVLAFAHIAASSDLFSALSMVLFSSTSMGVAPGGAVLGVDSSVVTLFACEDDARSSLRRLCDGLELAVAVEVGMIGCCEESGAKPSALARLGRGVVVGHERVWSACRLRAKLARPETPIDIPNRDHHHHHHH